ncbi:HAMP domain-containing sensor histidine kinase [uncultured Tateyamaria sp.]|uniref:sensor histidine kinase n=1 Tax=uncultured Tateyamaria sp. TaxID=455651 RepID=UPI002604E8DC|nr:HAMP domain-containing sensor histidine kinase [uncultured Tateyamaria sp.]
MLSLRHRALLGGIASGAMSVAVGTLALYSYIDAKALERFDSTLQDRHTQLVVGLSVATQTPDKLRDLMFDPAYGTPYSGRYWQVTNSNGDIYTSASLFDETFTEPADSHSGMTVWNTTGPENEAIRSVYQQITYEDGTEWGISVAESRAELNKDRNETRRSLLLAFALVGVIGMAGSILSMSAVLGPLRKLRADVAQRWDEDDELKPEEYPDEVSPLVGDINVLLHRNRDIVSGARRQAADLAHALKTPTAILRNELTALSEDDVAIEKAQEALDRIDAQLGRSLARMRAANSAELTHSRTDLSNSVNRLSRLFVSMAERDGKAIEIRNEDDLSVRMDAQDIEEAIGNLLDNALKWSKKTIHLTARKVKDGIELLIEDDGPGIPENSKREALRSGGRLDTSTPGTGLGLAISVDLLKAYGANLMLGKSSVLGGLAVRITIPAQIAR